MPPLYLYWDGFGTLLHIYSSYISVLYRKFDKCGFFEKNDKSFEKIDKSFEKIDKNFEKLDKNFEKLDKNFEKHEKNFEKLDNFDSKNE